MPGLVPGIRASIWQPHRLPPIRSRTSCRDPDTAPSPPCTAPWSGESRARRRPKKSRTAGPERATANWRDVTVCIPWLPFASFPQYVLSDSWQPSERSRSLGAWRLRRRSGGYGGGQGLRLSRRAPGVRDKPVPSNDPLELECIPRGSQPKSGPKVSRYLVPFSYLVSLDFNSPMRQSAQTSTRVSTILFSLPRTHYLAITKEALNSGNTRIMTIRDTLNHIFLPILNRQFAELRAEIIVALNYMIRTHLSLPPHGDHSSLDKSIFSSTLTFLNANKDHVGVYYEDDSDVVDWLIGNDASNRAREIYLRIEYRLSTDIGARDNIDKTFRSLFDRDLVPLKASEIWAIRREVKELRRRAKKAWIESKSRQLYLSPRQIAGYLPLFSLLLICAGYFHTSILYRDFGIDSTQFFSIGDYLSTSLQQIEHAVWLIVGLAAGLTSFYIKEPAMSKDLSPSGIRTKRRRMATMFFISSVALGALCFRWEEWAVAPSVIWIMGLCMLVIIMVIQELIPFRYLKYEEHGRNLFTCLVLFSGIIVASSYMKINVIRNGGIEHRFEVVRGSERYTEKSFKIIGSNSSYVFIWNKKESVQVIPLANVSKLVIHSE